MSYFEVGSHKHQIPTGESPLGASADGEAVAVGAGVPTPLATLRCDPAGQVIIYRASPEADVSVNGVRLGDEPTPLLHGDKVVAAAQELVFVDERRGGSTMHVHAISASEMPVATAVPAGPAGRWQNGRIVCLTDGREYQVGDSALTFGRDAASSVVVPGSEVSREHSQLMLTPDGYVLIDKSTNGCFVNDQRIQGSHLLQRGDRFRIGDEEFRFYADPIEDPGAALEAQIRPTEEAAPPRSTPPPVRDSEITPVDSPRDSSARVLARLIVRSEPLRGQRFDLVVPVINIGRADFNDIVLDDASVSTQHAKFQRREGIWVVVDVGSTNGTFVDGERVADDTPLSPGSVVRFGNVSTMFEPTDDDLGLESLGSATAMIDSDKLAEMAGQRLAAMAPSADEVTSPSAESVPPTEADALQPGTPDVPLRATPRPKPRTPEPPVQKRGVLEIAIIVLLFAVVAAIVWFFVG